MSNYQRLMVLSIVHLFTIMVLAQSPIANRLNAAAKRLPEGAMVMGKYADNNRHCLYFSHNNKIFRQDVVLNITEALDFAPHRAGKIKSSSLSKDRNDILFCTDTGSKKSDKLEERYQLWKLNSLTRKFTRIATGFTIDKNENGFTIRKRTRCLNPKVPSQQQRWMVQDLEYDSAGKIVNKGKEYEYIR